MNKLIFSIGHSNRAFAEFLQKLQQNKIKMLIDVRSIPKSRFFPHYSQNALREALEKEGIIYLFKGHNIGGRGVNEAYEETIDELVSMVKEGKKICVMCSESDPMKCHRYTILTPSFEAKGLKVEHILYEK